jgi:hypothetical protein
MTEDYPIEAGQEWALPCLFSRDEDSGAWRPLRDGEDEGLEIRKVVAVVALPKGRPDRVFYRKIWVAPDGYTFGKLGLQCAAISGFRSWRRIGPSWNPAGPGGASLRDRQPLTRHPFWITFSDETSACCEAASEAAAMTEAMLIKRCQPVSAAPLPHPANPRLNGDISPAYCRQPEKCAGHAECQKRIACTD